MSYAGHFSPRGVRQVVLLQAVLVLAVAGIAAAVTGWPGAAAAAYGGGIAIVNATLLAWYIHRGRRIRSANAYRALRSIYLSSALRLMTIIAMLAFGFGWLELAPLVLLAGFIAGQFGLLLSGFIKTGNI
jgi:F0F1-type ATP synthase assembly protein I